MTKEQATEIGKRVLNEEAIIVSKGDGHSGFGWYAWDAEYPEEGSHFCGEADVDEAGGTA